MQELDALQALLDDGVSLGLALRDLDMRTMSDVRATARAAMPCVNIARAHIANLPDLQVDTRSEAGFLGRLRRDHFIETDEETALSWALRERDAARAALDDALNAAGIDSLATLQTSLRADQVSADDYDAEFARVWKKAAEHAVSARLVDWPAWPLVFRPQPRWAHGVAPHLYFCSIAVRRQHRRRWRRSTFTRRLAMHRRTRCVQSTAHRSRSNTSSTMPDLAIMCRPGTPAARRRALGGQPGPMSPPAFCCRALARSSRVGPAVRQS